MRDTLSAGARLFALACAAAFILVTALVLCLFDAERQVFNPAFYKRALMERGFYDQLLSLIAPEVASLMKENPPGETGEAVNYFRNLKPQDWEIILSALMTPEWLRGQTESAIDQVFVYLESADPSLRVIVSLLEAKVRLQGEPGMRAFLQMLKAQPACTEEQLLAIAQEVLFGGLENMPLCMPPEDLIGEFRPEIQTALVQVAASVPNEVDLGGQIQAALLDASGADLRPAIRRARTLVWLSLLLPAGLLLLITIFAVRSFRDWLFWWGIPFLLAGLAALGVGLLAAPLISGWVESYITGNVELPAGVAAVASGVGQDLAQAAIRPVMLQGGLLALVGFGMALLGLVIPRARR